MALTWPYMTTAAKVRTFIGDDADATLDTKLEDEFITPLSSMAQRWLHRNFDVAARTEVLYMHPSTREILLPDYPVTSVTSIKAAADGDWTNVDAWDATDGYFLDTVRGILRPLNQPRLSKDHMIQIVYTAGMAADFATFDAAYPDIVLGGAIWAAELFRRRKNLGKTTTGGGRGKTSTYKDVFRHPPEAAFDLLVGHRRRRI